MPLRVSTELLKMSELPPIPSLPRLSLKSNKREELDVVKIIDDWFRSLQEVMDKGKYSLLDSLFLSDCHWRDVAALSWKIACKSGVQNITEHLKSSSANFGDLVPISDGALSPRVVDYMDMTWIQSGYTFKTKFGEGVGILRLGCDDESSWRAWTLSSILQDIHGSRQTAAVPEASRPSQLSHIRDDHALVVDRRHIDGNGVPRLVNGTTTSTDGSHNGSVGSTTDKLQVIIVGGGECLSA
jgi:hypothetical protein